MSDNMFPKPDIASLPELYETTANLYVRQHLTPALAVCFAKLLFPEFMEYHDCVLWKRPQSDEFQKWFNSWFEKLDGDLGAVERICNHSHIMEDDFRMLLDGLNRQNRDFFVTVLKSSWLSALNAQFPEREFAIDVDDDYIITFWQVKHGSFITVAD